uniref:hypothetical protein n=1 Tax=Bordetella pseudohinzii TaxID=1331258 RepID=UPI001F22A20B
PAWLKGLAVIDMGSYRRFYRHPTGAFLDVDDRGLRGNADFICQSGQSYQATLFARLEKVSMSLY